MPLKKNKIIHENTWASSHHQHCPLAHHAQPINRPHHSIFGRIVRIGEILNSPLALVLSFFGLVPFAAISFLAGALISRFGWIAVSKVSRSDPESVFAAETLLAKTALCSPRSLPSEGGTHDPSFSGIEKSYRCAVAPIERAGIFFGWKPTLLW